MTTPDAPDTSHMLDTEDAQYSGSGVGMGTDLWGTPSFVHELSSGVKPSPDPVTLDVETAREVNRKLREIEESRAAAAVSGRDYLIK